MAPQINYEVLLFTATKFSKKQFCGKENCHQPGNSSEQLQEACWNGLVFEILPDIIRPSSAKMTPYIWEVLPAKNFIEIKIGTASYPVTNDVSVNPYWFLFEKNFN